MPHTGEIQITESFDNDLGQFENYHAYSVDELNALRGQSHRDVRNMRAEVWSTGTVAPDASRNNWNILTKVLAGAPTVTMITSTITKVGAIVPIDFTDFGAGDFLSVVLPAFPLNSLDLDACFIDFTSSPTGSFTGSPPQALCEFNLHTGTSNLVNGADSELRIPFTNLDDVTLFDPVDWSAITGVRLRFLPSSGTPTVKVGAIRLVKPEWQHAALDIDTIDQVLVAPQAPTGNPTTPYGFTFPLIFRAHEPSNEHDPRPVDASMSVIFNTGEASGANSFSIYFREQVTDFLTMLDLDGMAMEELTGSPVPDTGDGKWDPRDLSMFTGLTMDDLEGDLMYDLQRIPDFDLASWFRVTVAWGSTTAIIIEDSEENALSYEPDPLDDDTTYVAFIDVEENTAQVKIYPVDVNGQIQFASLVFDTGAVTDDFFIKRRKGRIGYSAALVDGNAYISDVRTRFLNFAEYRSLPLRSITAVEGAQIFAEYTPDRDLFAGLSVGPDGGTVVPDKSFTNSDESFKITNLGLVEDQGVVSNWINFENFDHYRIEYDIFYPATAITNAPKLYLRDVSGNLVQLTPPSITPDVWDHVRLYPVEGNTALTGLYQLYWVEEDDGVASTWWLDNVKVIQESMIWEARSQIDDPWGDVTGTWVNATETVNGEFDGVLFPERGRELQVRGRALRQDVLLGKVKVIPKYAELGRVVWGEQESATDLANTAATGLASSTQGSFVAANALDNDPSTFWQAVAGTTPNYRVDWGSAKTVDKVYISWGASFPTSYYVETSLDASTWVTVATITSSDGDWDEIEFDPISARYIRIVATVASGSTGHTIYNITVRPALSAPTADIGTPDVSGSPLVEFDASASTDGDGFIVAYHWAFGDGAQGYGKQITHTYEVTGTVYNATLTVIDNHGNVSQDTDSVAVA